MRSRLLPAHAAGNRGNDAFAQIERVRSCHTGWPPFQPDLESYFLARLNLEVSVRSRDTGEGKRCVRDVIEAGLN
jgi:hypothetical protein